jgi:thymidylate synthase
MWYNFNNATDAFETLYFNILKNGTKWQNTLALFNVGFYLNNPIENLITTPWRNWSLKYAEREWKWYLSGNPSAVEISKHAPTWKNMMDENGNVRSNYGYQWQRGDQLEKCLQRLKKDQQTRQACITLLDMKEANLEDKDVICTYAINFKVFNNALDMSVMMRSNDLIFGFCNDQFCFSRLQNMISRELDLEVGSYFHFANNLHVYEKDIVPLLQPAK